MSIFSIIITVIGLALFEIISSIDNAVINAEVLVTLPKKARNWFLFWGMLFAVFVMRGLLPWAIIWATSPQLGPIGALTATFQQNEHVRQSIEQSAPILQAGGGTFLLLLFFHWLFMEPKRFGLKGERFFHEQRAWFAHVISFFLAMLLLLSYYRHPAMVISVSIGTGIFFITNIFKRYAEKEEQSLVESKRSVTSKLIYLEILDATFSVDGVLGAFAFTLSVPLILIGNGIGAFVLRKITVSNMDRIQKYVYLKNGAMYAIFFLSLVLLIESFSINLPEWIAPLMTVGTVGYFFWKSHKHLKKN